MKTKMQFFGGLAGELTGSCYVLSVIDGKRSFKIMVDAGLIQCNFKESLSRNQEILKQFDPKDIDFILLTHAHIDHVGRLPLFTKNGFKGRVICTTGTERLIGVMLEDSAKIQMAEANYSNAKAAKDEKDSKNKRGNSRSSLSLGNYDRKKQGAQKKSSEKYLPLYTTSDAEMAQSLVKNAGYDYHEWIKLAHNIHVKFYPSGHVMGGAIAVVRLSSRPKPEYICFSGDLGRKDGIILPPPEVVQEPINHLILESTYGGRAHPGRDQETQKLLDLIKISQKKGKRILIPSFALERTQEIIYLLSYYMAQKEIDPIPIYLDSPLGSKITAIFSAGWDAGMFADQSRLGFNPFSPQENKYFHLITEALESDELIKKTGNYIVIAGSGMCDAGRIRGHLRANLGDKNTMVFLVGYMAEGSLGRRLKEHSVVKMNRQEIKVAAEIISFDSFSAHADGPFLVDYAKELSQNHPDSPNLNIFIVHGEKESAKALKADLEKLFPKNCHNIRIPGINEETIIQ
ncbi:MAG: MBL fold metallo-hydrolase [Candidatus Falkowbacteria bacterium]|nr:MBL fold metallo-hydrolase [Candidatus Falkowbacteria bacterium]